MKGLFVWQIDIKTQVISKSDFTYEAKNFKEGHWYCIALNEKNASRKFNNMAKEFIEAIKPTTT